LLGERIMETSLPITTCVALAVLLAPRPARADDGGDLDLSGVLSGASLSASPASWLPMRPIGHFVSAGHAGGGGPRDGFFVGVDTGVAVSLPAGYDPALRAWTFGVRTGYELRSGVALQLRYDYLGVAPHFTVPEVGPAQIGAAGVRYSIPFLVPLPFFEALWGVAVNGDAVSVTGGLGVGGSVPIGRYLRLDASVRDWLMPIDGQVHQVLTFELGAAVSFGGPGR
jgi:hypothetical protein